MTCSKRKKKKAKVPLVLGTRARRERRSQGRQPRGQQRTGTQPCVPCTDSKANTLMHGSNQEQGQKRQACLGPLGFATPTPSTWSLPRREAEREGSKQEGGQKESVWCGQGREEWEKLIIPETVSCIA